MQKLLIKGKNNLSGTIPISGSKNATLPILAASIFSRNTKLKNIKSDYCNGGIMAIHSSILDYLDEIQNNKNSTKNTMIQNRSIRYN